MLVWSDPDFFSVFSILNCELSKKSDDETTYTDGADDAIV